MAKKATTKAVVKAKPKPTTKSRAKAVEAKAVEAANVVEIGGKVKFPRGEVVYCGSLSRAQTMIAKKRLIHLADKAAGYVAPASTSGDRAPAVCLGYGGAAKCGLNGSIVLTFHDGKRPRHVIGYAGEDGIEADNWYRVSAGKLQLCPDQNSPI